MWNIPLRSNRGLAVSVNFVAYPYLLRTAYILTDGSGCCADYHDYDRCHGIVSVNVNVGTCVNYFVLKMVFQNSLR